MSKTIIPYSGYGGQGLQVFTPVTITTVAPAASLDVTNVTCIRVSTATDYKINDTGTTGTMPAGCTGIASGVTSLEFPNGATVEVM
jgi:hypothetical protein